MKRQSIIVCLALAAVLSGGCALSKAKQSDTLRVCQKEDYRCMLTNPRGWEMDMASLRKLREKYSRENVLWLDRDQHMWFEEDGTWRMEYYSDEKQLSSIRDETLDAKEIEGKWHFDARKMTITGTNLVRHEPTEILVITKLTPYTMELHELNQAHLTYRFRPPPMLFQELE